MTGNPIAAFSVLLALMLLPAVAMVAGGGWFWYRGQAQHRQHTERLGKMLVMFGCILLVIVVIVSFFLTGRMPGA
ncbi:MAG: hypothetical protein EAY75_03975 [Bacteroidetes bacterium]|nr:MAG: hypothetical protein EAY75_03975 [Bacteroidota bacterium]